MPESWSRPRTQYATSDGVSIAYQVLGEGPFDLVYAPGWLSNVEYGWEGADFSLSFTGPTRAIECAKAIRQELKSIDVDVRASLHTGECERRGSDLSGIAVHIAARICSRASDSCVVVSATVKDLVVGSGLEFTDMGRHDLKGVPGEWQLFRVLD
jgi:class 3 adenylate cyclase